MSTPTAPVLRERARALRLLARRLQQLELLTLPARADVHTWAGPTPHACHESLSARRGRLLAEIDGLWNAARALERTADSLVAGGPR